MKRELTNVAYDIYHSRLKNRPPGPFPPIAGEPRLSRFPFFLARFLPLQGNPGIPAFSISSWPVPSHCEGTPAFPLSPFLPGPFPPIAREPRPSRFLLSSWPVPSRCEGTPAIPLSFHPPFSRPETGRASSVQVRPERQ
jgi:hypothetical protein